MLLVLSALALTGYAGWEHMRGGKTVWVTRPTPATCWLRKSTAAGDLYVANKVQAFHDTIRHYGYGIGQTNGQINTGFWIIDSDGDVTPASGLPDCSTNVNQGAGEWTDVEWDIDGDGDLVAKE